MYRNFILLITCIHLVSCGILAPPIERDLDWWQNSVVYEIFPLSFKDSNGDGFGDFQGLIQKLDYLRDIGVDVIWLTPFLESPLKSGGYDISNYLDVQKVFGTMDDFKILLNKAHEKNIKVIMDFVPNHTSDEHIWFKNSVNNVPKYADYYVWKNATNQDEVLQNDSVVPIPPNNWKRIMSRGDDNSAWIWSNTRKQFYYTQFIENIPDLNYRCEKVHEEMKNILNYWLDIGIDGLRIDALKHTYENAELKDEPIIDKNKKVDFFNLDHIYTGDQEEVYDLLVEWRKILDEFKRKDNRTKIIMTESYSPLSVLYKYYTVGVEIPTNFKLMEDHVSTVRGYTNEIKDWITTMPKESTFNVVLQNHDHPRTASFYGPDQVDGRNALSIFLPGVSIVYYGGEIGMEDISDPINFSRSPMQWDDTKYAGFTNGTNSTCIEVHPNYVTRNVKAENSDPKSSLNFFKSLTRLRQTETLKKGGLAVYEFNDQVLVVNRFLPGNENYTLVINMDSKPHQIKLSDQMENLSCCLHVVFGSGNSNFYTGNMISTDSLILSPGATVVLSDRFGNSPPETNTTPSSSTQLYIQIQVLLLCLCVTKIYYS